MLPCNVDLAEKNWRIAPHKEALFKWGCVKSVQIRSSFWSLFSYIRTKYEDLIRIQSEYSPNTGKYGPEKTPYLDTFHAV